MQQCDTVFLLDFPLEICLAGVKSRIGHRREDMPWVESEFDEEFKQWIHNFSQDALPHIYELLEKYGKEKNVVIFKSRKDMENYGKACDFMED